MAPTKQTHRGDRESKPPVKPPTRRRFGTSRKQPDQRRRHIEQPATEPPAHHKAAPRDRTDGAEKLEGAQAPAGARRKTSRGQRGDTAEGRERLSHARTIEALRTPGTPPAERLHRAIRRGREAPGRVPGEVTAKAGGRERQRTPGGRRAEAADRNRRESAGMQRSGGTRGRDRAQSSAGRAQKGDKQEARPLRRRPRASEKATEFGISRDSYMGAPTNKRPNGHRGRAIATHRPSRDTNDEGPEKNPQSSTRNIITNEFVLEMEVRRFIGGGGRPNWGDQKYSGFKNFRTPGGAKRPVNIRDRQNLGGSQGIFGGGGGGAKAYGLNQEGLGVRQTESRRPGMTENKTRNQK